MHDTALQMDYSFLRGRFDGHLTIGKVDTTFENFRPFAWMTTIEFGLGSTFADIKSLHWNSGRSHLEASGRVSDFKNPHLAASYDAHVDLGEAAAIARRHDLREGYAEFKGSGNGSLDEFTTSGALALSDLGWQDDQIAIKKASVNSDYSLTDQQIKLSKLQGKLFGGSISGDAQIDNWLHSVPPPLSDKTGKQSGKKRPRFARRTLQPGKARSRKRRECKAGPCACVCAMFRRGRWRPHWMFRRTR